MRVSLVLLAAGVAGCGDIPRSRVHGRVTLDGRPVVGGVVVFIGRDDVSYLADIGPGGRYAADGVPRGPARVAVQGAMPRASHKPPPPWIPGPDEWRAEPKLIRWRDAPPPPPLPAHYADPARNGLAFVLTEPDQEWTVDLDP